MKTFSKFLLSTLAIAVAGTPTWVFLFLKSMVVPVGFLQNAIVFGMGIYFLGGLQFILLLFLIFVLMIIIAS
jgi:hypothetical protein